MKKLVLFFFLSLGICNSQYAEIRYVSHSGSSTPPYTSWETAADSIMSAINISSFGDTIYVANGVYEEQVVMIPGLSLIGAGMDSCVIDTRDLVNSVSFASVSFTDSCLLKGFEIKVYYTSDKGRGINATGSSNGEITQNRINTGGAGFFVNNNDTSAHPEIRIYDNIFSSLSQGIHLFNSDAVVRKNIISTDPNSQNIIIAGVTIEAFYFNYSPLIDSNTVITNGVHLYSTIHMGIYKSFGTKPVITNNIILLNGEKTTGMTLSYSDSGKVFNNLIVADSYYDGISNTGIHYLKLYNNYIAGNPHHQATNHYAIEIGPDNEVKNNVISNAENGIGTWEAGNLIVQYNNLWNNEVNYLGFTGDTTNLSVDPMVVNDDTSKGELDYHLQMFSPLIDRGDPNILDKDSTRSDIGLYGGPFGESYNYQDLPPRAPVNIYASVDTDYILIRWNKNTEADINHYNLYRDTTENFTADSTTFVATVEDTFYLHIIPQGINNLYFKLTAEDNQGNVSDPSEELHIVLTGTKNNEQFTINSYRLFQNYPNPFNPTTRIGYRLKERGYVKLYVYDIKGELVETLVNKTQDRGYYEVEFTGSSSGGTESTVQRLASGIYIYQILVQNGHNIPVFSDMKKMVYLK